jgi:hypothetical protein
MSPVLYPAALALSPLGRDGERPTPGMLQARCEAMREGYPGECRVLSDYVPLPWEARVNPRRPQETASARR